MQSRPLEAGPALKSAGLHDVVLKPRRPERARHPWIFESEVASVPADAPDGNAVRVVDQRGRFLATAYLNRRSKIRLRVLSWHAQPIDAGFWSERIAKAIRARGEVGAHQAIRLVNAEGDMLPGLVADWYAGWVIVQITTLGIEMARDDIVAALAAALPAHGIYERSDVPERKLEGLELRTGALRGPQPPPAVEITEGPARLLVDLVRGQKTGLFLDQCLNRRAAAAYAAGRRVANCFAYTGAFSVHAALAGARETISIDVAEEPCRLAEQNLALNQCANSSVIQENCFDWLRAASDAGQQYGVVILDPPAFARGRSALEGALRGYKEINLRALKLLEPGGLLVTCSCSRPVTRELFGQMLREAARDARRDLQILEQRGLPPDHPVLLAAPETDYLQCVIARAL